MVSKSPFCTSFVWLVLLSRLCPVYIVFLFYQTHINTPTHSHTHTHVTHTSYVLFNVYGSANKDQLVKTFPGLTTYAQPLYKEHQWDDIQYRVLLLAVTWWYFEDIRNTSEISGIILKRRVFNVESTVLSMHHGYETQKSLPNLKGAHHLSKDYGLQNTGIQDGPLFTSAGPAFFKVQMQYIDITLWKSGWRG